MQPWALSLPDNPLAAPTHSLCVMGLPVARVSSPHPQRPLLVSPAGQRSRRTKEDADAAGPEIQPSQRVHSGYSPLCAHSRPGGSEGGHVAGSSPSGHHWLSPRLGSP